MFKLFKKSKKIQERQRQRFSDIVVDIDEPLIDPDLPEVNDIPSDQFGISASRLYRPYEPDFEKAEKDGEKAYLKLCKYTGYQPKHVRRS